MDVHNQAAFVKRVEQSFGEHRFLIVDLAQADFLDSSALGALVALTNQARKAGGDLCLVSIPAQISRTLELLKLDQFFTIVADVETALQAQLCCSGSYVELTQTYVG